MSDPSDSTSEPSCVPPRQLRSWPRPRLGRRVLLADRYLIGYVTLQIEPNDHVGCDELGW